MSHHYQLVYWAKKYHHTATDGFPLSPQKETMLTSIKSILTVLAELRPLAKAPEVYTMDEVSRHIQRCDAWCVIYDTVYNISKLIEDVSIIIIDSELIS